MATIEHYETCIAFNPLGISWGQRGSCNIPYRTGNDGMPECRWCAAPLPHKSRAWCSFSCRQAGAMRMHWQRIRSYVIKRDQHRCQLCTERGHEVDHIVAVIEGGTDDPANLRLLCVDCHKRVTREMNRRRHHASKSLGLPLGVS